MKKQTLLTLLFMLLVTACAVDRKPYLLDMQSRYNHKNFIQDEEFLTKHEHQRMSSQMNNMLSVFREIRINIESSKFSKKELAQINYLKSYKTLHRFTDLYLSTLKDYPRALQSAHTSLFFAKQIEKGEESSLSTKAYQDISMVHKKMKHDKQALKYEKMASSTSKPLGGETKSKDNSLITDNDTGVPVKEEYKSAYHDTNRANQKYQELRRGIESSRFSQKQLAQLNYDKIHDELVQISDLYVKIGDFPRALQSARNSLFFAKITSKQKESEQMKSSYGRMATISKLMGDDSKALEYSKKGSVVKSNNKTSTPNSYSIAMKYESKGDYAKALEYQKKTLLELEESMGAEHYMSAKVHTKISILYLLLKKPKKALPHATKALRINKKIFGKNSFKLATNYLNLSIVYMNMNNIEKSYLAMKASIENLLNARESIFTVLNKKEKLENESYNLGHFFYVASLYQEKYYAKKHKIAKETFDIWLRYKDEISNSESYLISLKSKTKDMEVKAKIDNLIETRKKYSSLYLKKISNEDAFSNSGKHEIKRLEEQKNYLESYLSSKIEEYKNSLKLKKIKSSQLSQKLQKNELYIDFAHIKHDNSYVSFILNNKNQVSLHRINSKGNKIVKTLESIVDNVLTFLLGGETENNNYAPMDVLVKGIRKDIIGEEGKNSFNKANAKKLYRILLAEPYLDNLKNMSDVKKLIISPDGILNLLPFEVLIDYDKYLIEEKKIIYVSSGKEFLKAHREKNSLSKSDDIVVFSYLDYENTDGVTKIIGSIEQTKSLVNYGGEVGKLSDTKDEAQNIKDIFTQKNVHDYSGKSGTKEVLNSFESPKILHLSTHSFYGEDDKNDVDSLLKSGMALSGYNNYVPKADTRGIMSALEFSNLNLYHSELVLFSSCQSGRGNIHSSEGVYGLNKGAKLAGAKRVISTLWSVEAIASLKLTNRFYEHLKKNHMKGYANALRETKKEMIKKAYHPFFWAGFVENGID